MKTKSFLPFVLLTIILASFQFVSCNNDDSEIDGYSDWRAVTAEDSAVFANAKAAFLSDSENAKTIEYKTLQFLPATPKAVRTQTVKRKGMNYQFDFLPCTVTVYKADGEAVGEVTEVILKQEDSIGIEDK